MANEIKKVKYLNNAGIEGDKQDNVILNVDKLKKLEAADLNGIRDVVNDVVDILNGTNQTRPTNFPSGQLENDDVTTEKIKNGSVNNDKLADDVKAKINTNKNEIAQNKIDLTANANKITSLTTTVNNHQTSIVNNENEINTLKAASSGGVNIDKVAATATRAADKVRHEVGLNPTRAFADFSTLGITTAKIIADYDNNSLTSEYGIFNAIIAKMETLKLEIFAVQGRLDDTNNALFSLFFKQVLTKVGGDFNRTNFPNIYQGDDARITVLFSKFLTNYLFYILSENPNKNFNNSAHYIADVKNLQTDNWNRKPASGNSNTYNTFGSYHEYIDEKQLFIKSNDKITTAKEWKTRKDIVLGLNYNLSLLTITFKSGKWKSLEDTPIKIFSWDAKTQELTLSLPYKFGGYIKMRGRMKYANNAVNCELAFKNKTQESKYYSYERSGTVNNRAPSFVGYPNEPASRNYFMIFEGADVGKARIIDGEFSINDDLVECTNFKTLNIKNNEFYKATVDSAYNQANNPFRDSSKKMIIKFRNVNSNATIKDGSFLSLDMTKGVAAEW